MHLEAHIGTPRQKDIKLYYRRQKGAEYAYTRIYAHRHIHTLRIYAHTHTPASAYTHARYIILRIHPHTRGRVPALRLLSSFGYSDNLHVEPPKTATTYKVV